MQFGRASLPPSWAVLAISLPLNSISVSCFSSGLGLQTFERASFSNSAARNSQSPKMAISPYSTKPYPIGKPGVPWGVEERVSWREQMTKYQRSYQEEVLVKVDALRNSGKFDVEQYGSLSIDSDRYPLFAFKSKNWDTAKPTCLVTGGVHGYETSGVQGALLFLQTEAEKYSSSFNLLVAPCVSPWGYEHIQRWNNNADDPNRNFIENSPSDECNALMKLVHSQGTSFTAHIDLHETTDTDETEFRPALAARDGKKYEEDIVPDGFYLCGNTLNPQPEWHAAIIESVRKVTHIAPADKNGNIIGSPMTQEGCIAYPIKELGLCASVTGAPYCTTTEVYPDSPKATDEMCNRAQVAAVTGALDHILALKA